MNRNNLLIFFLWLLFFSCEQKSPVGHASSEILTAELKTGTGDHLYEINIDTSVIKVISLVLKVTNRSDDTLVGPIADVHGTFNIWWVDWSNVRWTKDAGTQDFWLPTNTRPVISGDRLILAPGESLWLRKVWRHQDNDTVYVWNHAFFKTGPNGRIETIRMLFNAEVKIQFFKNAPEVTSNTEYFRIIYFY